MVTRGEIAPEIRNSVLAWVGCVVGALDENEYRVKLEAAGFVQIEIEPTRTYTAEDARESLAEQILPVKLDPAEIDGKFFSGFIRAVKPRSGKDAV